jgi:hypothetical protein
MNIFNYLKDSTPAVMDNGDKVEFEKLLIEYSYEKGWKFWVEIEGQYYDLYSNNVEDIVEINV